MIANMRNSMPSMRRKSRWSCQLCLHFSCMQPISPSSHIVQERSLTFTFPPLGSPKRHWRTPGQLLSLSLSPRLEMTPLTSSPSSLLSLAAPRRTSQRPTPSTMSWATRRRTTSQHVLLSSHSRSGAFRRASTARARLVCYLESYCHRASYEW